MAGLALFGRATFPVDVRYWGEAAVTTTSPHGRL
jgi:hypothetical protein